MSSSTRKQLEEWIKNKKVSGEVLDIGGSQLPIAHRIGIKEKSTAQFTILDLEKPHEEKAEAKIVLDLNQELHALGEYHQKFDYAVCLEVSEYWWNPYYALENISWFLKRGGTLFISFHFLYPVHNPVNQDYLRYTRAGAVKLLEEAGFEIVEMKSRRADHGGILRGFYEQEGMRPARGYDFHQDVGCLIEAKKK